MIRTSTPPAAVLSAHLRRSAGLVGSQASAAPADHRDRHDQPRPGHLGLTYALPLADETGASTTDIVRAHAVVSEVLQAAGAEVSRLSGCCGLAGNFGIEKSLTTTSPSPNNSAYP